MDTEFSLLTAAEIETAQKAWAAAVVRQDVDALAALYDFDCLLFKPTMAAEIRTEESGTRSYFVGGNASYPNDHGFLHNGFVAVEFQSARGPMLESGGRSGQDMGHYIFRGPDGSETLADYSFSYHKRDGKVLITLHHSSFNVGVETP